jgi:hypothetical protein
MRPETKPFQPSEQSSRKQRGLRRWRIVLWLLAGWAIAAYLLVPLFWRTYFRHHPSLAKVDRITHTADGHPGDPINIGLVGTDAQIIRAMVATGWYPANAITFHSSVRIVVDSVFRRPDDQAPVSSLFLFGRKQDLAFEQPVGDSPRQRHHVRFWRSDEKEDDRSLWLGAATFDKSIGFSHATGEVTHHIGADVDAERDRLLDQLEKNNWTEETYWADDFHRQREGRNGGGDPWQTDGRLVVVALRDQPKSPTPGDAKAP